MISGLLKGFSLLLSSCVVNLFFFFFFPLFYNFPFYNKLLNSEPVSAKQWTQ